MLQPKKKFKALMVDCDGTLILSKQDVLPTSVVTKAIFKASSLIHVGIATQRSFSAYPILKHLKLTGPSIISGGARIIDSQTLEVLREELIKIDDLNKVIEIIKNFNKKTIPFFIDDNLENKKWSKEYVPLKPIAVFIPDLKEEDTDHLRKELSVISSISVHKVIPWDGQFGLVVAAAQATKQHGIFEVAKILNIDTHEIIGVGDSYNDFPLLMACGLKVAMGNAVDDLKEIADYIAPSVEKDGVADVINKYIL